ncbi:BMC domain-containing protein [Robertmurraya andreesenii]|uniref:Microcompartment protein CcmL/EutN n=1 Tax=Anoxybacillus andreesenii TaxID=1325932 RepID=A0ABT9V7F5_9BACL|nr:BMC domain-containing protein [Robertmurraya andreesenii]MDQ0156867.1 microcompartment protein CcmL/EutN [Robertmurraya andreesenii]
MNRSIGLLEVVGFVTAAACVDRMVKSAYVDVHSIKRAGSGMITVIISGDLASVKEALEVGEETASSMGELVAVRAIARPYEGLERLLDPE